MNNFDLLSDILSNELEYIAEGQRRTAKRLEEISEMLRPIKWEDLKDTLKERDTHG